MHNYFNELNKRFSNDLKKVQERRDKWNEFSESTFKYFGDIKTTSNKSNFFETINYHRSDSSKIINQNYLHFWAGKKYTGISSTYTVVDESTRSGVRTKMEGIVEDSGCLSILQAPKGMVFFIIYPCKSKVLEWKDEYLIYKRYKSPENIEYADIKEAVEFYLKFMLFTSFCSEPNLLEKIELWWMKFRFAKHWWKMFKGVGTAAKLSMGFFVP